MVNLSIGDGVVLGTLVMGIFGLILKYGPKKKLKEFSVCQAHSGVIEALKNQSSSLDEIKESLRELFRELRSYHKEG